MTPLQRHLVHTGLGLVGGTLGTVVMQKSIEATPRLPELLQPDPMMRDPSEVVVGKAEDLMHHHLAEGAHRRSTKLAHYVYGAGWSTALGLALSAIERPRLRRSPGAVLASGAALGALVWAVGYLGWLPRAGVTKPVTAQRPGGIASALLSHLLYGVVAALPLALKGALVPERLSLRERVFGC